MSDITSDSTTVQPYDSAVETKVSGLAGTMLGGKKRRRRTRGKRHTLKKAHKVKSRKLKSRRAKRRRGKRSRRRHRRGGSKGCTSGTSSFAVAGNTLGASESMLANPPPVSPN
jgi:hypothetical protein